MSIRIRRMALLCLLTTFPAFAQEICAPSPPGLLSWWRGEGNGNDSAGQQNGVVTGLTYAAGKVGNAFLFSGAEGAGIFVGVSSQFDFSATSSFTFEGWIRPYSWATPEGRIVFIFNYPCNEFRPEVETLSLRPDGRLIFWIRDRQQIVASVIAPDPLVVNTWYHVSAVREVTPSGKKLRLYLNGVQVGEKPDLTVDSLAADAPDYLGRRIVCGSTNPWHGMLDEMAVYSRALTAAEIARIHAAGSLGRCVLTSGEAAIAGSITDSVSGQGLGGISLRARNAQGEVLAETQTTSQGRYLLRGLASGSYFLSTANTAGFVDEIYNDHPCPIGCAVGGSDQVQATAGAVTTDIDFRLDSGGGISGSARDSYTLQPLPGIAVGVRNAAGLLLGNTTTNLEGQYRFRGLPAGNYFVSTAGSQLYFDEVWHDLPCPALACQPTSGTPIAVLPPGETTGIDFALDSLQYAFYADNFASDLLDAGWQLVQIGGADQGMAVATGGQLQLTGDGEVLYQPRTDSFVFLRRANRLGNFRTEIDVAGFPFDAGGPYRKAGLMIRASDAANSPMVQVSYIPNWEDSGHAVLQFRYRATAGGAGDGALGSNIYDMPAHPPVRLAIERIGDVFRVFYSTNGGVTWKQPAGGSRGSISLPAFGPNSAVGPFVVSYSATTALTAAFDNFVVTPLP